MTSKSSTISKASGIQRKKRKGSDDTENDDSDISNLDNIFGNKKLIDLFYERDVDSSNCEVSDFLSSEDSCDERLP